MPTLKQITCHVILGDICVKEYAHRFTDGAVETHIAVPDTDEPFSLVVESKGYIAPGLAAYVYIDGEYQANRNKIGLLLQSQGGIAQGCDVKFTFRQKEEKIPDGKFIARNWSFAKLKKSYSPKDKQYSKTNFSNNVGTIEVLVLRCASRFADDGKSKSSNQSLMQAQNLKPEPRARSKASEVQSKSPSQPSKELEPGSQGELGGLFGLFDGANDEPVYGDYLPRPQQYLPIRHQSCWRTASQNQPYHRSYDQGVDMRHRGTHSSGGWIHRSPCGHPRERPVEPNTGNTCRSCHRETQEPQEFYAIDSRDTESRDPRPNGPSKDELERLVVLHEQLRRGNAEASEILKSKELFERSAKTTNNQRLQELSSQRLQEFEQQLQKTNAKRVMDTDFIFECLADMDEVQLAFARSALRSRDIILPTLDQVQRWLRRKNYQVRASIRSDIEKEEQSKDGGWQEIGEGVVNINHSKAGSRTEQQEDQKSQRSQQTNQDHAWDHDTGGSARQNADWGGYTNSAARSDRKEQTNAWDDCGQSEQHNSRWSNDEHCNKTKSKCSSSKSMSTKVASQQHQKESWGISSDQADKNDDVLGEARTGTSSRSYRPISSHSTSFREPKRVIKPYWSSWGDHGSDNRRKDGTRDVYQYPAQPAPTFPKDGPKGVSHGLQTGQGTTYVHKNVQPKYMDTMNDPYAVFVFHYRSKQEIEKLLGRNISDSPPEATEDLDWENLMQLSKEDLVHKLMKSAQKGTEKEPSQASKSHVSNDEVTPEDSISQVVTSKNQSVAAKGRDKGKTKHRKQENHSIHQSTAWHTDEKSTKKSSSRKGGYTNQWGGNDRNQWNDQRDNKSKAPSSVTHEHFAGEAVQTTNGAGGVAW